MNLSDFVLDNLDRIQRALTEALDSLTYEELAWRPAEEANSIGFILWHQVRCEDTQPAEVAEAEAKEEEEQSHMPATWLAVAGAAVVVGTALILLSKTRR